MALCGTPPRTLLCNSRLNNFVTLGNARKRRFTQVSSLWRDVPRKGVKPMGKKSRKGQKLTGQKSRMTGGAKGPDLVRDNHKYRTDNPGPCCSVSRPHPHRIRTLRGKPPREPGTTNVWLPSIMPRHHFAQSTCIFTQTSYSPWLLVVDDALPQVSSHGPLPTPHQAQEYGLSKSRPLLSPQPAYLEAPHCRH